MDKMERNNLQAEIDQMQKEADLLLSGLTAYNMIDRIRERNLMLVKINNLKKRMAPLSTAERQMTYGVSYHGKTPL